MVSLGATRIDIGQGERHHLVPAEGQVEEQGEDGDLEDLAPGEVGGLQASDAPAAQQGVIEARLNTRLLPGEGAIPVAAVIDRSLVEAVVKDEGRM